MLPRWPRDELRASAASEGTELSEVRFCKKGLRTVLYAKKCSVLFLPLSPRELKLSLLEVLH